MWLVGSAQRHLHVLRHRARDQQQIRVPRTRDESNAQPLDVVEGIVERVDLELAAVAGARIDVTDAQRAAEHGANVLVAALSRTRSASSAGGGGSVTMPMEAIWRSVFSMGRYRSCPL